LLLRLEEVGDDVGELRPGAQLVAPRDLDDLQAALPFKPLVQNLDRLLDLPFGEVEGAGEGI
jgi:hypothetical protein